MEKFTVESHVYRAENAAFARSNLLFIAAKNGVLGCGYFDVATADKVGEAVAVVTGVKCYDDMLAARVARRSIAAAEKGVAVGMTGREALEKLDV